jgi:hypothetical protein
MRVTAVKFLALVNMSSILVISHFSNRLFFKANRFTFMVLNILWYSGNLPCQDGKEKKGTLACFKKRVG